jgi:hypothetical protein
VINSQPAKAASFLAKVSLVGRPFRVENGVVVALSTPFLYGRF